MAGLFVMIFLWIFVIIACVLVSLIAFIGFLNAFTIVTLVLLILIFAALLMLIVIRKILERKLSQEILQKVAVAGDLAVEIASDLASECPTTVDDSVMTTGKRILILLIFIIMLGAVLFMSVILVGAFAIPDKLPFWNTVYVAFGFPLFRSWTMFIILCHTWLIAFVISPAFNQRIERFCMGKLR